MPLPQQQQTNSNKQPARRTVQIAASYNDPTATEKQSYQKESEGRESRSGCSRPVSSAMSGSFHAIVQEKLINSTSKHKPGSKLEDRELEHLFKRITIKYHRGSFANSDTAKRALSKTFTSRELELIINNIGASCHIKLPGNTRSIIQNTAKRVKMERNIDNKYQKDFATVNTAKFCQMFYRSTKLPPIPKEKIIERTSKVLLTENSNRRSRGAHVRRLDPLLQTTGCHTPAYIPYREFGEVNTDPRDMFVDNFEESLPKVVKRNYYHMRSREADQTWKPVIRAAVSPLLTSNTVSRKVNTRKDTYYINCGYNTLISYKRESQDRIRAAQNGACIEKHWDYRRKQRKALAERKTKEERQGYRKMNPRPVSPPQVTIARLSEDLRAHATDQLDDNKVVEVDRKRQRRSTTTEILLGSYEDEIYNHWNSIIEPLCFTKDESVKHRFVVSRLQSYKEKLKHVYTLLCTLRNMRLFHLKQKRLPKKLLRDLRANPFSGKDNTGLKKGRSASVSRHIGNPAAGDSISVGGSSSKVSKAPSCCDWRKGHGQKSSSNSLNSTLRVPMSPSTASILPIPQLTPLPNIVAGPHLETWEDFLAVNPKTDRKTRLRTPETRTPGSRGLKISPSVTNKDALKKTKTPLKAKKSLAPLWRLVRRTFVVSQSENTQIKGVVKELQAARRKLKPTNVDRASLVAAARQGKSQMQLMYGDVDMITKIKIDWLRSKILLTDKVRCKLASQYKSTLKHFKHNRERMVKMAEFSRKNQKVGLRFEDRPDIWDSMLRREAALYQPHASEKEFKSLLEQIERMSRFCTDMTMRNVTGAEAKMKLISQSLPAYEILTLSMQIAFKFLLGNVLCLDPDLFDTWMKERGLPLHQSLSSEPIVPKLRLKELQQSESILNSELTKLFNEAGIYQHQHTKL